MRNHREKQILKAWRTPTPRCIGFTTHHLSLKDRNSLKPWLLTQGGKRQTVLWVEVSKYPIDIIKERALFETHMPLWFCCSAGCGPAPSTESGTGKWCLKEITETVLLVSIENTLIHHLTQTWWFQNTQTVTYTSRLSYLTWLGWIWKVHCGRHLWSVLAVAGDRRKAVIKTYIWMLNKHILFSEKH